MAILEPQHEDPFCYRVSTFIGTTAAVNRSLADHFRRTSKLEIRTADGQPFCRVVTISPPAVDGQIAVAVLQYMACDEDEEQGT